MADTDTDDDDGRMAGDTTDDDAEAQRLLADAAAHDDQQADTAGEPAKGDDTDGRPDRQPAKGDDTDWKARSRQWESRAKANRDAAAERDQLKATLDTLRKALDPDAQADDDPHKVAEKAVAERDARTAELRSLRLERAAERAGRKAGADVDALLDSRGFLTALGGLDPDSDDFDGELAAAVAKAVEHNPRLKAASQAPTKSVTEPGAATDTNGQLTRADLAGMTPEQITEARRKGRLASLLRGSSS